MYVCPKCGGENWLSLSEAKGYGKFVCLMCSQVTRIEPIRNITVNYVTQVQVGNPKSVPQPSPGTEHFVVMLVQLGYKKSNAKALVDRAVAEGHFTGDEEAFAQYLVQQVQA